MKLGNGFGGVSKIGGNKKRRNPWRARITDRWEWDENKQKAVQKFRTIGYYPTRKEALLALSEFHKMPMASGTADVTFAEVFKMFVERNSDGVSKKTVSSWVTNFNHSAPLHDMRMHSIRTDHMQDILDSMTQGKGLKTHVRSLWSQMFKLALEKDIVQKNYASFVQIKTDNEKPKINRRPFTKQEIAAFWSSLEKIKNVDLLLMMIYLGVRPSEFIGIRSENVHLEERYIEVHGTKTKAAKRVVPIHRAIAPLIEKRKGKTYLAEMRPGRAIRYPYLLKTIWPEVMSAFNITDTNPHCTRYTFTSLVTEAEVSERMLKKMLGHSTGDITEHYTKPFVESLIAEIDKIKA